jgi:hypothetical protein
MQLELAMQLLGNSRRKLDPNLIPPFAILTSRTASLTRMTRNRQQD